MKSSCRPRARALDRRGVEHVARRARRRHDDVGLRELLADPLERDRLRAEALGELGRVRRRAVRDEGDARAPGEQVARGLLADLAGADQQDRAAVEVAEHLLRERGRRGRDGRGALADRGLRAHLAAGVQRLPEHAVEQQAGRPGLVRGAHLAEDLALPGHERVEPGRDAEQVQRGGLVVQAVERVLDLRLERGENRDRARFCVVGVFGGDVELGAVARREADGLAELLRERGRLLRVERNALAELDRRVVMRGADENEAHQLKWTAGSARRTTTTSAKPMSATYAERRPLDAGRAQHEIRGPHDPGDERRDDERVDALTVVPEPHDADRDAERERRDGDCDGARRQAGRASRARVPAGAGSSSRAA